MQMQLLLSTSRDVGDELYTRQCEFDSSHFVTSCKQRVIQKVARSEGVGIFLAEGLAFCT